MAYTKQTFTSGQILKASDLNTMSQGIVDKQDKLVSGTSIKTINGQSLLGSGNIVVEGGDTIIDGSTLGAKYAGFAGKCVSFLGDSITTFCAYDGTRWTPSGWVVWYGPSGVGEAGDKLTVSGITDVDKTWWKQVLNTMGMKLCTNASWSGSCVTGNSSDTSGKIGCGDRRIAALTSDGVIKSEVPSGTKPDIIVIFMGINDFSLNNYPVGSWDMKALPSEGAQRAFDTSYALMLKKVITAYPHAEVFCCTLLETTGHYDDTAGWPLNSSSGATLKDYNNKIVEIAHLFGANVIDLHACGINYFNIGNFTHDKLHPNAEGAKMMARKVVAELSSKSKYATVLGEASEPETVYYTVTYKYINTDGNTVKASTTQSVAGGTVINTSTSSAPRIEGYDIESVSPTSVTVNANTTITYTYRAQVDVVYHTVTYKYLDNSGREIKTSTTQSVADGVTLNLITSNAPSVSGYRVSSVNPSGSLTVTEDVTVTYTYIAVVMHTVTYAYVDKEGSPIKDPTTKRYENGTTITVSTDNAPKISGYSVSNVSMSGSIVVNGDMTITYTYTKEVWYVDNSTKTSHGGAADLSYASFAYNNSTTKEACIGVPINALRFFVHTAGIMSYGKVSSTAYEKLGEITISNPSNTELQIYKIPEITLNSGERLWVGATSDTGMFYFGRLKSGNALGYFDTRISSSNPNGISTNENLSIDIGYVK